ncbi:hypothetical protein Purlil1_1036 [Purpureocillium lilacinum]|uniref:Uncharacterized protein n=3 Tax=Purpureocillium lilacinum TaxID=33203 RepID=A0ABR0CEG3_PURLI|nr:hypothetical protein Purlil1_1036 [Purpureocillium lilacinum]
MQAALTASRGELTSLTLGRTAAARRKRKPCNRGTYRENKCWASLRISRFEPDAASSKVGVDTTSNVDSPSVPQTLTRQNFPSLIPQSQVVKPFTMKASIFTLAAIAGFAVAAPVPESTDGNSADVDYRKLWRKEPEEAGTDGGIYSVRQWGGKRDASTADDDYRKIWRKDPEEASTDGGIYTVRLWGNKKRDPGTDIDYKKIWRKDPEEAGTDGGIYTVRLWGNKKRDPNTADDDYRKIWRKDPEEAGTDGGIYTPALWGIKKDTNSADAD